MTELAPPENYTRTCLRWEGGWLEFDAVSSETITLDSEVTVYPVEPGAGAGLTDHVQPKPVEISLEAIVTDSPIGESRTHNDGIQRTPVPRTVVLTRPLVPAQYGPIAGLTNQAVDSVRSTTNGRVNLEAKARYELTPRVFQPGLRRVANVLAEFDDIRREARLLTVQLGNWAAYDNCILRSISPSRDATLGGAMSLSLGFIQIALSTTEGSVRKKPAKPRSQNKKSGGNQQSKAAAPKDEAQVTQEKSLAAGGLEALAGFITGF